MTARCSTPDTICLLCGDRGWSNAFVYCVKCLNVAVHRYCLDFVPSTVDEFVHWVCDFCDHSTCAPSSSTIPSTTVATASLQPAPTPTPLDSAGKAAAPARDDGGSQALVESPENICLSITISGKEMVPTPCRKSNRAAVVVKSELVAAKAKENAKTKSSVPRKSTPKGVQSKLIDKPATKPKKKLLFEDEEDDFEVKKLKKGIAKKQRKLVDEDEEDDFEEVKNLKKSIAKKWRKLVDEDEEDDFEEGIKVKERRGKKSMRPAVVVKREIVRAEAKETKSKKALGIMKASKKSIVEDKKLKDKQTKKRKLVDEDKEDDDFEAMKKRKQNEREEDYEDDVDDEDDLDNEDVLEEEINEDKKVKMKVMKCRRVSKPKVKAKSGSISSRGNMINVFKLIKTKLSPKNIGEFKKSCFGHLFEAPQIQFQGQFFFLMLNALDRSASGSGSLVFKINDSFHKFGDREFVTITGLNMKFADMLPSSSKFHTDVFGGEEKMFSNDIKLRFIEECGGRNAVGKGDSELCLKLALLWVVFGLFTNKDLKCKRIQVSFMHLVDDLDIFNNYAWGRVAFDFFESSFYHVAKSLAKQTNNSRPSADICGFSIPLQVWAYDVIPKFGRRCASVTDFYAFPRILRWTTNQFFHCNVIKKFFLHNDANLVVPFVLSDEEKVMIKDLVLATNSSTQVPWNSSSQGKSTYEKRIKEAIEIMKDELDGLKKYMLERLNVFQSEIFNSLEAYTQYRLGVAVQKHIADNQRQVVDEPQDEGEEDNDN